MADRVVEELVRTEAAYVRLLGEDLLGKYRAGAGTGGDWEDDLFLNAPALVEAHAEVLAGMRAAGGDAAAVVAAMVAALPALEPLYCEFVGRHPATVEAAAVPAARALEERTRAAHTGLLDLPSLLILPVQRMPRWELLLRELARRSAPGAAEAERAVREVNARVNEARRVADHMTELLGLERRLKGLPTGLSLVAPHRRLVRHGVLVKRRSGARSTLGRSGHRRMFWLLSDMLVWSTVRPRRGAYTYRGVVPLTDTGATAKPRGRDEIEVSAASRSLVVACPSRAAPGERDAWLAAVRDAIEESAARLTREAAAPPAAARRLEAEERALLRRLAGGTTEESVGPSDHSDMEPSSDDDEAARGRAGELQARAREMTAAWSRRGGGEDGGGTDETAVAAAAAAVRVEVDGAAEGEGGAGAATLPPPMPPRPQRPAPPAPVASSHHADVRAFLGRALERRPSAGQLERANILRVDAACGRVRERLERRLRQRMSASELRGRNILREPRPHVRQRSKQFEGAFAGCVRRRRILIDEEGGLAAVRNATRKRGGPKLREALRRRREAEELIRGVDAAVARSLRRSSSVRQLTESMLERLESALLLRR